MRSRTIAWRPTSAAVPVRICGGVVRWRRAIGRTMPKLSAVNTANTTTATGVPRPTSSVTAAAAAPIANGNKKKLRLSTSAIASTTAAISHRTQASICNRDYPGAGPRGDGHATAAARGPAARAGSATAPRRPSATETTRARARAVTVTPRTRRAARRSLARLDQRRGEVVGVERAQVLERLADPDQLDRDAELGGDREGDAALGRPVELGEHDPVDRHRLREHLRLTQPVLAGRRVDGQQCLVRRVGQLLADHAAHLGQLGHERVLRVQASGGVDDDHVGPLLATALD